MSFIPDLIMFPRDFLVRQAWRISELYRYVTPFIGILNTTLYAIIAIGVTDIVELTIFNITIGAILIFLTMNVLGYILDKSGVFSKDYEKKFRTTQVKVYRENIAYQSLMIAKNIKMSTEEIEEAIENHPYSNISNH